MNNFPKTKITPNKNINDGNLERTQSPVNFKSSYKATTPVYPLTVDVTPPSVSDDQLPPLQDNETPSNSNSFLDSQLHNSQQNRKPSSVADIIQPPSKFYEPPRFDAQTNGNFESQTSASIIDATTKPKNDINKNVHWKELRRMFLIPDYEFPLDSGSRPSYGEGPSSFQVNPFVVESKPN